MLDTLLQVPTFLGQAETVAEGPNVARLVMVSIAGIALLLYLIMHRKIQAFVALLAVSVLIGLGAGMSFSSDTVVMKDNTRITGKFIGNAGDGKGVPSIVLEVRNEAGGKVARTIPKSEVSHVNYNLLSSLTRGMGGTLGFVALVVGLGAMFGQMLEVSGGAQSLAKGMLNGFGEKNAPWALGLAGFLISIPAFFDVGFVILAPVLYGLARQSKKTLMFFAMPLMAGMATTHAFIPPTPGPIGVAGILEADLGLVILFGFIAGIPAMIIAGPVYARFISEKVPARIPDSMEINEEAEEAHKDRPLPTFGLIAAVILLPLVLIVTKSVLGQIWGESTGPLEYARQAILLLGDPIVALLLTTLVCFRILGTKRGFSKDEVQEIATKAMEPAGIIILVTGAGGVLKQVLIDSNVGGLIANGIASMNVSLVIIAFLIAVIVRVMQGSATVAMLTGAGLVYPLLPPDISEPMKALLVIPIAGGATFASHVNDSGFWLVNRYLGMTVPETLKTWTACTTIIAFVGLIMAIIISFFIPHSTEAVEAAAQTAAALTP